MAAAAATAEPLPPPAQSTQTFQHTAYRMVNLLHSDFVEDLWSARVQRQPAADRAALAPGTEMNYTVENRPDAQSP